MNHDENNKFPRFTLNICSKIHSDRITGLSLHDSEHQPVKAGTSSVHRCVVFVSKAEVAVKLLLNSHSN